MGLAVALLPWAARLPPERIGLTVALFMGSHGLLDTLTDAPRGFSLSAGLRGGRGAQVGVEQGAAQRDNRCATESVAVMRSLQ